MPPENTGGTAAPESTTPEPTTPEPSSSAPTVTSTGNLRVEDRSGPNRPARGLAEAFRADGFPGETAVVDFGEFRAATFTGSLDNLAPGPRRTGVNLGADSRYAWPVFPQVNVEPGDTSVQVLRQSARTLPAASTVIRAIDAVTTKPEVSSVLEIVTESLKQVAAIQSNIPNVYLEQPAFNSTIEGDLRLTLNEALDKLVLDDIAASGFQAPAPTRCSSASARRSPRSRPPATHPTRSSCVPRMPRRSTRCARPRRPASSTTCSRRRSSRHGRSSDFQ